MNELLINDKNKNQFYESILKSLNCDTNEIDIKINNELLSAYINNVFSKEIDNDYDLLNPLIIKISKFKTLYEKYIEKLIKINYSEYFIKIKLILNDSKNFYKIKNFCLKNIDYLDLSNEIENEISNIYAKKVQKDNFKNIIDQKWFINYIIKKEAIKYNLNPDVKFINLPPRKKYIIIKENMYIKITNKISNKNIIDLRTYNANKIINNKKSLSLLLDNCFIYLQNIILAKINITNNYNKDIYSLLKEIIAYNDGKIKNISNPLFAIIDIEANNNNNIQIELNNYIDELVIKKPELLDEYPLLKLEYNHNGYKKTLRELINTKLEKINDIEKQINEYNKILNETDNEIVKSKISTDLGEIYANLPNIKAFHDDIIYNSLKLLSILDLSKLLTKIAKDEIVSLKEAVITEKNIIIRKLETNRKKIFKPATFLKNEEILTKEYTKAASYESKINDYEKEQK